MKAIIWKEWREALLIAASAMIAVSLICAWMLNQALTSNKPWENVWSQGVILPFTICAPLIGIKMGVLQILPELKRDQWAFLVHRPISIGTIFWGKVLAGLSLYFAILLLPLMGVALWLSRPGHTPGPFIGQMFLAPLADILGGVVFYFAAILVTLRFSRSRHSYVRLAAFIFALVCTGLSTGMLEFWQSLLVTAVGVFLAGSAAWGTFISFDNYQKQSIPSRAGLIVSLYIGIAIAIMTCVIFIASMMESAPSSYSFTNYRVDKAGRIVKVTQSNDGTMVEDLQGKIIKPLSDSPWTDVINETTLLVKQGPLRIEGYRSPQRYAWRVSTANSNGSSDWFFIANRQWFELYAPKNYQRIGFVGPEGFSPAPPQHPFKGPLRNSYYSGVNVVYGEMSIFQFGDGVYHIDFRSRRLQPLHRAASAQEDFEATDFIANNHLDKTTSWSSVVLAKGQLRFFSDQNKLRFTLPLELPSEEYSYLSLAPVSDDKLIVRENGYKAEGDKTVPLPSKVREVSGTGKVLRRYELPGIQNPPQLQQPLPYFMSAFIPPGAVALLSAYCALGSNLGNEGAMQMGKFLGYHAGFWWTFTLLTMLAALPCALLAWRFGVQHQASPKTRAIWALSVFFAGLFGLLTLLFLHEWPARLPCANCGTKRNVAQQTCAACAASWPAVPLDGTEIFA